MKRLTNILVAAAVVTVAAGMASAQTLKADIPFTFHAGKKVLLPGTYRMTLNRSNGSGWFALRNEETGQSVILAQYTAADVKKDWEGGPPRLAFECAGPSCALREVYTGGERSAYRMLGPKPEGEGPMRIAEIRMTKAD